MRPILAQNPPAPTLSGDQSVVEIKGKRQPKSYLSGPAHVIVLTPESPADYDFSQVQQAGLASKRTGYQHPSGWSLPSIRGQDARLTEVYIDGMLLTDPFLMLPAIDQLDMRSFGAMEIYQGVSPWNIRSTNAIGGINFVSRWATTKRVGIDFGRPYGRSEWVQISDRSSSASPSLDVSLFVRNHHTDGRYAYYSDESTPYDRSDDRLRIRNDMSSSTGMSTQRFRLRYGPLTMVGVRLWSSQTGDLPSLRLSQESSARRSRVQDLYLMRVIYGDQSTSALLPEVYLRQHASSQVIRDPDGMIDPRTARRHSTNTSRELGLRISFQPWVHHQLTADASIAGARSNSGDERKSQRSFLALKSQLSEAVQMQLKAEQSTLEDRHLSSRVGRRSLVALTGAVAWAILENLQLGLQAARFSRPPSILERYGDGANIDQNSELRDERMRHLEGYLSLNLGRSLIKCSVFRDYVSEKIVFVPGFSPELLTAQNLEETRTDGFEFLSQWKASEAVSLEAQYLYMNALDVTDASQHRSLPAVPKHQVLIQPQLRLDSFSLSTSSRYRGLVYRDTRNTTELPAYWLHDLNLNARLSQNRRLSGDIGIGVYNVLDTKRVDLSSPDDSQSGSTAISEVNGQPLPGRHWKVYAQLSF